MVLPANAEYIIIDSFSQSMLVDLDMILSGLSTHSKLMNMLWAENVENRINDVTGCKAQQLDQKHCKNMVKLI